MVKHERWAGDCAASGLVCCWCACLITLGPSVLTTGVLAAGSSDGKVQDEIYTYSHWSSRPRRALSPTTRHMHTLGRFQDPLFRIACNDVTQLAGLQHSRADGSRSKQNPPANSSFSAMHRTGSDTIQDHVSRRFNRLGVRLALFNPEQALDELIGYKPDAVLGHDLHRVGSPAAIEASGAFLQAQCMPVDIQL